MSDQVTKDISVSLEFTPNPNSLKYVVDQVLLDHGVAHFPNRESADKESSLASKIFSTPGIVTVLIGRNFVTITKEDSAEWDKIHVATEALIKEHLASGEKAVSDEFQKSLTTEHRTSENLSDIENRIIQILNDEIRPAVAMDGGDITFDKFENGIVYLYMQGSCAGCPSSTMTLKMGIETRLRELIPEVQEVVSMQP